MGHGKTPAIAPPKHCGHACYSAAQPPKKHQLAQHPGPHKVSPPRPRSRPQGRWPLTEAKNVL